MTPLEFIKSKFNFPEGSSYSLPEISVIQCAAWMKEYNELQSAWISVEDRLPEGSNDVLIFTDGTYKEQVVGRYNGRWLMELGYNYGQYHPTVNESVFEIVNVTHWQPLPSPPNTK